jgi:hypothetical protein
MRSRNAQPPGGLDRASPAYWKAVKTGDFVALRDLEAFDSRLAAPPAGAPASGAPADDGSGPDYRVGEVRRFALRGREAAGGRGGAAAAQGELTFLELGGGAPLYLCLVEEDSSAFELRLYFTPQGLLCGTRDELIDSGQAWLFLPPPDPEDFKSCDLEYAPYPDLPEIVEGGRARKLLFAPAGPGTSLYGEAVDTGAAVIITQWLAEAEAGGAEPANPLLLVLEEGWMRPDGSLPEEGGYLSIMLGKVLMPGDIEHYPS